MNEETEQEQRYLPEVTLPIDWHVPDTVQSRYVNNVIVQPGKHEIVIFFFETQVPPFAGPPQEYGRYLQRQGTIRAECVGKMVVDPELMPEIIKAMQAGLDGYNTSKVSKERER
jgi:hypothetical protein